MEQKPDIGQAFAPTVADRPWERLQRELAAALAPQLPALADEVIAAIGEAVPEYRRPLEGAFGHGLRAGVRRSLQQFVDLIGRSGGVSASSREVYRELGRGEHRSGRTLDALQAAYRLGGRISWRRLSEVARGCGADAETVSLLAESIFAYIEEVSASSVEGYAQAQAELAGERDRRLRRLVAILVQGHPDDADIDLQTLAIEAGWRLPRRLAVLACEHPDVTRLSTLIGDGAIGARLEDITCVLVPGAGEHRTAEVERAVQRLAEGAVWRAAIGPFTTVGEAPVSFARASSTLALQQVGVLPASRLALASEHLLTLLLHQDPLLTAELAARCLAPLGDASPRARERLERTLLAWLRHRGNVPAVAEELHVHSQTVRYRLGALRELLGDALDDPDRRLELELALRTRLRGD
jgi:PucR C-terminal helix-turn-helix domain